MTRIAIAILTALLLIAPGCGKKKGESPAPAAQAGSQAAPTAPTPPPAPVAPAYDKSQLAVFQPLPASVTDDANPLTPEKIALGKMLYFDKRLSKNQDVSCNSCHDLARHGVDGAPTSKGHKGQLGGRNSPTVYNAAGHLAQFWDGRAANVEAQAKGPVLNPIEMALPDAAAAEKVLKSIPGYVEAFAKAFPEQGAEAVTFDNFAKAVGAFERTLVTPSRWDALLKGDDNALNDEEKKGLALFYTTGCITCHNGPYIGGGSYQKLGDRKPWPRELGEDRSNITKDEADKGKFKVPSLRNIDKTGPYFHDGKTADLKEAVVLMARHQLDKELSDAEAASIVTWLRALTAELPAELTNAPALPESGPDTPKPDPN